MQPIGRRTSDPPHCHAQVSRRSATTHHDDGETQRSRRDPTRHARGGGSATTIDPATARRPGREIWCGWSSLGGRCLGTAHCARRPAGSGIFNGPGPEPRRGWPAPHMPVTRDAAPAQPSTSGFARAHMRLDSVVRQLLRLFPAVLNN